MELAFNQNAELTKWVVREGLLGEAFVLVDVGVQDGESERWDALGDLLVVHGFNPIAEVVQSLTAGTRSACFAKGQDPCRRSCSITNKPNNI
jgi:hypothetical protein